MSELGNFLLAQKEKQRISYTELAARLGLGPSHLAMLRKGKRRSVNYETLNKMVAGISEDERTQAALLQAYFRDQTTPRRRDWINISASQKTMKIKEEPSRGYGRAGSAQDPVGSLERLLREEAVPLETVRAMHKIVSALPGQHSLQELVKELGNFTEDALAGEAKVTREDFPPSLRQKYAARRRSVPRSKTHQQARRQQS